jgi:hypothetical protein
MGIGRPAVALHPVRPGRAAASRCERGRWVPMPAPRRNAGRGEGARSTGRPCDQRLGAAVDAARAAYLVGRGDFLTVVDDFDRWLDARVELARRDADRFTTWAEVEALVAPLADSGEAKEQ